MEGCRKIVGAEGRMPTLRSSLLKKEKKEMKRKTDSRSREERVGLGS